MTGYIIYSRDDLTNDTIAYEIDDIECTVDKLFTDILEVNRCWQTVIFDDEILNELDKDTMLADIGLGSECTVIISDKELTDDEQKIIEEYSIEALEAYKIYMGMEDEDVEYATFSDNYRGHFNTQEEFVDYCLECEEFYNNEDLPWYLKRCIDREKDYLYEVFMNDYWEENDHYFWIH